MDGQTQWIPAASVPVAEQTIDPFQVRFNQSSIRSHFKDGQTIDDHVAGLRAGSVDPRSIPPIRVVEQAGHLFTLDNRRLEAFRRAGVAVPYQVATEQERANEAWKFTTSNDGTSIRIRG